MHNVDVYHEVRMTKAELVDHMEMLNKSHAAELEAQRAKTAAAEAKAVEKQTKLDTRIKGESKVRGELKTAKASMKGHTARVRKEQESIRKKQVATIRASAKEEADADLKAKVTHKQALATEAHRKKRAWKARAENAEQESAGRLEELKMLRCRNASIVHELEEMQLDAAEGDEGAQRQKQLEAWKRQQAMPTWQAYRAKGRGGGRAFDVDYRAGAADQPIVDGGTQHHPLCTECRRAPSTIRWSGSGRGCARCGAVDRPVNVK